MKPNSVNVLRNRKLSLENAKLVGSGATCKVYELPDGDVVKVLFTTDFKEAEREILLAKWVFMNGIPTAISYDVADVDGHPGMLYESLGRGNLRNWLRDNSGNTAPLLEQYLSLLKSINAIKVEPGHLPSAKQKAIEEIQQIRTRFTAEDYERIMALMDTIPEDDHLVHGDCHIKNIKERDGKLYLIDLDTLSVGDPLFELSGLCCCYDAYSPLNLDENGYNHFLDIDHRIVTEAYHYILYHYYEEISETDRQENLRKVELLTYLHMLHELSPENPDEKDLYADMYERVQERLRDIDDLVLKRC